MIVDSNKSRRTDVKETGGRWAQPASTMYAHNRPGKDNVNMVYTQWLPKAALGQSPMSMTALLSL